MERNWKQSSPAKSDIKTLFTNKHYYAIIIKEKKKSHSHSHRHRHKTVKPIKICIWLAAVLTAELTGCLSVCLTVCLPAYTTTLKKCEWNDVNTIGCKKKKKQRKRGKEIEKEKERNKWSLQTKTLKIRIAYFFYWHKDEALK